MTLFSAALSAYRERDGKRDGVRWGKHGAEG